MVASSQRLDALSDRVSPVRSVMAELETKFSRQQVKGLLAELITVPAAHRDASTALEIAAGGRLYSVRGLAPLCVRAVPEDALTEWRRAFATLLLHRSSSRTKKSAPAFCRRR